MIQEAIRKLFGAFFPLKRGEVYPKTLNPLGGGGIPLVFLCQKTSILVQFFGTKKTSIFGPKHYILPLLAYNLPF